MLVRDPDAEVRLYDVLRESFGNDVRTGTHLSALLNPVQEHWRRTKPPIPKTNAEIGYFIAGRGHEDAIARLLEKDFVETVEEVVDGIHLRPDFVAVSDRIIPKGSHAELKTRRMNLPLLNSDLNKAFQTYRDQVRGYMALKRQSEMYLIVLSLLEGKTKDPLSKSEPRIAVYKETMGELELLNLRNELQARKYDLEHGNWNQLPLCWDFLCGKWTPIKVGTEKKFVYLPKCPYYQACRPDLKDPKRGMKEPVKEPVKA